MSRVYVVYDGRAKGGDTSEASVLTTEDTLEAAQAFLADTGWDGCIYSYELVGVGGIDTADEQGPL